MHTAQPPPFSKRPQYSVFDGHGCEITRDDVIDAIHQIAAKQSTQFVSIALMAQVVGLIEEDIPWMQDALSELDRQNRILLSCVERPQQLASFIAPWFVRNASSIPCHEICVAPDSHRIAPLLQQHAPALPIFPLAEENNIRMTHLVEDAASALFRSGHTSHTQFRVLDTSTGRAA